MFEDIQEGIKEGDFSIAAIADFFEATSDLLKRECRDCNFHNQTSKISLVASVASSWARKVRLQTNKDYITLPDYIETDVMNTSLDATADIIKKLQDIPTNALWAKWSYFIIFGGLAALNLIFSVISG